MPQQTDIEQLRDRIRAYGVGLPDRDASGRFMLSCEGEDHIARACNEIMQTRMARCVTFYSSNDACLEMSVRNGRILALRVAGATTQPIDCETGGSEDAENALAAMRSAFSDCVSLTVSYSRLSTEIDTDGSGLAPESILALHERRKPVSDGTASAVAGCVAEVHLADSQILSSRGSDAGIAQLKRVISERPTRLDTWLEKLNDDLIEEIELGTGRGQRVSLDYRERGVQITLL